MKIQIEDKVFLNTTKEKVFRKVFKIQNSYRNTSLKSHLKN